MYNISDFGKLPNGESLFKKLLPNSISNDITFITSAQILDQLFKEINERVEGYLIYSRINELDEKTLNDLAWQFHLDYYEGWNLALNIEQKRELIKNAFQLHFHKGTRHSIDKVAEITNLQLDIFEWWENNDYNLNYGEFIVIIKPEQKILFKGFVDDINLLVKNLKNTRSHLKGLIIDYLSKGSFNAGLQTLGATFGKVITDKYSINENNNNVLFFENFDADIINTILSMENTYRTNVSYHSPNYSMVMGEAALLFNNTTLIITEEGYFLEFAYKSEIGRSAYFNCAVNGEIKYASHGNNEWEIIQVELEVGMLNFEFFNFNFSNNDKIYLDDIKIYKQL